nr:unnamed protein product [Callosobruchus chinensis]
MTCGTCMTVLLPTSVQWCFILTVGLAEGSPKNSRQGHVKTLVYKTPIHTVEELRERIVVPLRQFEISQGLRG